MWGREARKGEKPIKSELMIQLLWAAGLGPAGHSEESCRIIFQNHPIREQGGWGFGSWPPSVECFCLESNVSLTSRCLWWSKLPHDGESLLAEQRRGPALEACSLRGPACCARRGTQVGQGKWSMACTMCVIFTEPRGSENIPKVGY